jgi:hypothetical protein
MYVEAEAKMDTYKVGEGEEAVQRTSLNLLQRTYFMSKAI